jgi:YcxB-like protein
LCYLVDRFNDVQSMTHSGATFAFEYELGQAEQVRATRLMYHRRRDTRLTYAFLIGCLSLVAGFHAFLRAQGREGWKTGVAIVTAAVAGGIAASYFSPYWMVKNIRKNNRAATGPHTYRLSDSGLQTTSPGIATSVEWSNVAEAYESREFILFYVSKGLALLLPKRVVPDQELVRLRLALQSWLGQRGVSRARSMHRRGPT